MCIYNLCILYGCQNDSSYSGGRGVFTIPTGNVLMLVLLAAVVAADSSLSPSGVDTMMLGVATHPWWSS